MRPTASLLFVAVIALISGGCPNEGANEGPKEGAPTTTPSPVGPSSQPAQPAEHHDDHKTGQKIDREQLDPDGVVRRGARLSELASLTVSDAAQKATEIDGKLVKITGKVESVCQPMGCWLVLQGDKGEKVRITSKSHDIFVPRSSTGRVATVEGEFKVKVLPKETAQHYEDERELKAGETKKTFTEDSKELSVSVVGLELKPAT